ncbi:sentrin-specific protease 1 [Vigna unguiculata]|uniref:Sentrin-specific protease 1 n=2 Tax=Vigna unguiculata TaxID=3917 RepID=A0A4D6NTW6_VIGUN|nr:sentrin-specific protease 1 [Vigna unguiculata]
MTSHSEDNNLPLEEAKWKKGVVIMKKIIRARSEGRKLDLTFNVDTCRKNYVLKEAGKLLRTFRTNLANTYLKDENGNYIENPPTEPLEKYASMISEDVWKDFVAKRMDTSFQEKSLKNKERASHSKYPYRGSRKGYARIEQEMIKELGSNVSNIPRQELWKHARVNKAGEIENEDVQQVWNKCDSTLSKKKKINNTNESVAPKRKCQGKMTVQHIPRKVIHPNLPQWCNYLSSYMKLKPTESLSPIEIEKDIFGFDEHKEIINAEIIGEIIDYAWLGATTISIYIGYLYQNFIKPNHKGFFFLSPQITTHELPMKERMQKIVSIFLDNGVINKFVLAPINTGQHWVLLGINLKMEIIYYLDPLAKDINMRQDLKKLFDMVIQTYRAQRGSMVSKSKLSNIKWTPIKCPKQSNGHDCGYYICRYMKEIVTYCEGGTIPIDYFPSCRCQQYSDNQIIEVREDWCFYLISKCL